MKRRISIDYFCWPKDSTLQARTKSQQPADVQGRKFGVGEQIVIGILESDLQHKDVWSASDNPGHLMQAMLTCFSLQAFDLISVQSFELQFILQCIYSSYFKF
jgi:hypothetical protein